MRHSIFIIILLLLLIGANCTAQTDTNYKTMCYIPADQLPYYKGGTAQLLKLLQENLKYPSSIDCMPVTGRVYLSFWVLEDGSVDEVKVLRGLTPEYNEEAIRVLKLTSGHWEPAMQNGKPAKMQINIPVKFSLK